MKFALRFLSLLLFCVVVNFAHAQTSNSHVCERADVDQNGKIDQQDLALIQHLLDTKCATQPCRTDLNKDGQTNALDLLLILPLLEVSCAANEDGVVKLSWEMLSLTTFKDEYVETLDAYYWKPEFTPAMQSLVGKTVEISGHFNYVDKEKKLYILSKSKRRFSCCYSPSPSEVIDARGITWKDIKNDYRDATFTLQGTLKLNADDIYQMNFILEDTKVISIEATKPDANTENETDLRLPAIEE